MNRQSMLPLWLVAGVLMVTTRDAAAYVDPGSSSYLFQLLIAGLTAILFFFSSIKRRVVQLVRAVFRMKRPEPTTPMEPPAATDA